MNAGLSHSNDPHGRSVSEAGWMLLGLLRSLVRQIGRSKPFRQWKVKDVAAHLLDTALRGVSIVETGMWLRIQQSTLLLICGLHQPVESGRRQRLPPVGPRF